MMMMFGASCFSFLWHWESMIPANRKKIAEKENLGKIFLIFIMFDLQSIAAYCPLDILIKLPPFFRISNLMGSCLLIVVCLMLNLLSPGW